MDALKVGFSGTRYGLSPAQWYALSETLSIALGDIGEIHHGDCVGADKDAHMMAVKLGIPIVIHPPENPAMRAWCGKAAEMRPPLPYMTRNRAIVDETEILIAAPARLEPVKSSGTLLTLEYARKCERPVGLICPDGFVEWERLANL